MLFKTIIFLAMTACLPFSVYAQPTKVVKKTKIKVMLLGVYHFHNPGLDLVKTKDTDILSVKCQQEIRNIVDILAKYKPNKVFFETHPSNQQKMDSLYNVYLDKGSNDKNEITQIGFRLMKQIGLKKSYCVDANGSFPADSLIKTWQTNNQKAYFDEFMAEIKSIETEMNRQISENMSIKKRLQLVNEKSHRMMAFSFYSKSIIMKAGQKGNFIGADLAHEWYKRNIRIYSNIIRELEDTDNTIFVMFGASHQSVLEHLFALHQEDFEIIDMAKLLR